MEKVKDIKIVFENVESIVLPFERFKKLDFGTLTKVEDDPWKRENVFQSDSTEIQISYENESDLKYKFEDYNEPLGMFINNPLSNHVNDRPNILGRIVGHPDIVCLEYLDNEDEVLKTVYVPWDFNQKFHNAYMKVDAKEGILQIDIKEPLK